MTSVLFSILMITIILALVKVIVLGENSVFGHAQN